MVTGDQLAIAKETGRRLGMGSVMFPAKVCASCDCCDWTDAAVVDGNPRDFGYNSLAHMILDADGFAGVFPGAQCDLASSLTRTEHKFEIVKALQAQGHLTAMTGDGANDAPALSKADIGIAVEGATDAARGASDIVLTQPGLSTIIEAIRQSRIVFQRMQSYSIYASASTIRIVLGSALCAFLFKFDFPPFVRRRCLIALTSQMVLLIALVNDGTTLAISMDVVRPSQEPDVWDLTSIFALAITLGTWLAASTVVFVGLVVHTDVFESTFGLRVIDHNHDFQLHALVVRSLDNGSR